jgi:hypothetical protein
MNKTARKIVPVFSFSYYLLKGIRDTWKNVRNLPAYKKEYKQFARLATSENSRFPLNWKNRYPCLTDKTDQTPFDNHYIYHPAWAARILAKTKPDMHIDISSTLHFCSIVSAFIPVKFYDYRPAPLKLDGLISERGDLMDLPFVTGTVNSISCMHTIEHIGLGRYGDVLDYNGDVKAINELIRVTKPGGDILFVTPVGKPVLLFNAHRIYDYEQIISHFKDCTLQEFSLIPEKGPIVNNADPKLVQDETYGCGCFWFKKNN